MNEYMEQLLLLASVIVLISIFLCKGMYRFGVPSLLIFILIGMALGSDGLGGIYFDNFLLTQNISSIALAIIMFFGGFGTKWSTARPIAVKAVLLSSAGTVITALVTSVFAMWILGVSFPFGLLFGSVIASTDAASVFSILRSRRLNLKNGLAPLLEIESGSNDPTAFLMTIFSITLIMADGSSTGELAIFLIQQVIIGGAIGVCIAFVLVFALNKLNLEMTGMYPLLIMAFVIAGYSLAMIVGGNGFLCVYLIGIISGNLKTIQKLSLVKFFDSIAWFMQIMLFIVLGLLAFPSQIPNVALSGALLALAIMFVARPIAVFGILSWFKVPIKQQLFVSFVGLRGAASIVFAIFVVARMGSDAVGYDIFHIVFIVSLFSIALQGTLLPTLARKLDLVECDGDAVLRTFNDFQEQNLADLIEYTVSEQHHLANKKIIDANIPDDVLVVMLRRHGKFITPNGATKIMPGDVLVLSGNSFDFLES
ncbi:MAG: potassium/proton antiporter [Oscillospiraceae bacterium]|nr:potassium/proton antiporter [Oscillospiraceae bacterium]